MTRTSAKLWITPAADVVYAIRKLRFSAETATDFETYKSAYKETFGADISDEDLAAKLIGAALRKDRGLRAYKARKAGAGGSRRREPASKPAPLPPAGAPAPDTDDGAAS